MTKDEINRKIRKSSGQIDSLNSKVITYERKLEELERLKVKISNLQTQFESRQSVRTNNLSKLSRGVSNLRMMKKYYEGMNNFLNGDEFNRAYSGLSEAKARINSEINNYLYKLDDAERQISQLQRSKMDLTKQLKKMNEQNL